MNIAKLLRLDFLPNSSNIALLVLRLWVGGSMLFLHGLGKLTGFKEMSEKFMNLFGMGQTTSLALAIFGELFCSALLIVGLFTRFAAFCLIVTMAIAFGIAHNGVL